MKKANEIATTVKQGLTSTQQHRISKADPTQEEREKTNYFFARMETIYGKGKFVSAYPDETSIQASKREWFQEIGGHEWGYLERQLDLAKKMMGSGVAEWPNPGTILNLSEHGGAAGAAAASFKPLPDLDLPEQTPEVKRIGRAALDSLQESLDDSDYKAKERNSKAVWEQRHKEEMQAFQRKFGTMMIAKGEDGLYRPTNIPVPRSNGICDEDRVYTGTMEDIPEAFQ